MRLLLTLFLFSPLLFAQDSQEWRTLTDAKGRTMEAKVLEVRGDSCKLERRDGKVFTVKIDVFSPVDQAALRRLEREAGDEAAAEKIAAADVINEPVFEFNLPFKSKTTKHFNLLSTGRSFEPAAKHAEDVWERVVLAIPGVKKDFEGLQFAAPEQARNRADFTASENRFLYRIHLLHSQAEYQSAVRQYAGVLDGGTSDSFIRGSMQVTNFTDFENRFLLIYKEPGRSDESYASLLAHTLAANLVQGYQQKHSMPLWMAAGMGYWMEHQMFRNCRVLYLDYDDYYARAGEMHESEMFDTDRSWTPPVKSACRKNERYTLTDVIGAEVAGMTPRMAGYIFALHMYLLSDPDKRRRYSFLNKAIREGTAEPDATAVLKAYGFPNEEAFNNAWYEYILGNTFR